MRNKIKLTEKLVAQLPELYKISVEQATNTWWYNIRPAGGMRLTALGFKALANQLDIKYYAFAIEDPLTINSKTILKLDRLLQEPYYIVSAQKVSTHILFFGSREAMLVNLYGNLDKFLDNYTK